MRLFNRIRLLTPESIELELTLAGIGSRALALLIDYHIIAIVLITFWFIWSVFSLQLLSYFISVPQSYDAVRTWLLAIAFFITFILLAGYFVFFEVVWQGQTPGKRFTKIRVIRDDGRPVGLAQALLRALLRVVDDYLFIGVFFILFGQREKRIGDWVAGTVVVQEERPYGKSSVTVSREAEALAVELAQHPAFSELLPDDFAVIREYLQRRNFMDIPPRRELSSKLAQNAKRLIRLEVLPFEVSNEQFLEAIYLAYQKEH
jgi:uncharacterized RDD family membrane protein YckC